VSDSEVREDILDQVDGAAGDNREVVECGRDASMGMPI
jgi:hypothetical protein